MPENVERSPISSRAAPMEPMRLACVCCNLLWCGERDSVFIAERPPDSGHSVADGRESAVGRAGSRGEAALRRAWAVGNRTASALCDYGSGDGNSGGPGERCAEVSPCVEAAARVFSCGNLRSVDGAGWHDAGCELVDGFERSDPQPAHPDLRRIDRRMAAARTAFDAAGWCAASGIRGCGSAVAAAPQLRTGDGNSRTRGKSSDRDRLFWVRLL